LKRFDFEKLLDLRVNFGVISKGRLCHDPVHESLHDFLILLFIEGDLRPLLDRRIFARATFNRLLSDLRLGLLPLFLNQSILNDLQCINLLVLGSFLRAHLLFQA